MNGSVHGAWRWLLGGCLVAFVGCAGEQSALEPAGREAEQIGRLFWWMLGGGAVVWAIMFRLTFYALRIRKGRHSQRSTLWLVVGGGAVVPTLVLTVLLSFGLAMLPGLVRRAPEGSRIIEVEGVQWWWRVRYPIEDGRKIDLANEVCIPVGEPVEFQLTSADVIHSFWVPSLGGKVDMIPGRRTRLVLHPTRTGIFRGACAEYCGTSHAWMNFYVRVVTREEFDRWLDHESQDGVRPEPGAALRGAELFLGNGCGACHTIRGTQADGKVGPDLTHFGSRHSVAAGALPNDAASIERWLRRSRHIKPDVHMPTFNMLSSESMAELVAYLEQLR